MCGIQNSSSARRTITLFIVFLLTVGCSRQDGERSADRGPLIVYNAGSLAQPIRAALDSFSARTGVRYEQENAGSLETARKLTELGKIPDLIALADHEVFPNVLMPEYTSWYARFARNRMVIAYGGQSRFADEITPDNWYEVMQRPGVEIGRSDPDLDPAGYRALLAMQLAEMHYGDSGLARRLLAAAPERNVRPKEVDLVALVQAGELDYIWQYESVAQATGLRFLQLPPEIDLGSPEDSLRYSEAVVSVLGKTAGDTLLLRGSTIVYGFSIPDEAPNPELARRFAAFLLGDGAEVLRQAYLPVLDRAVIVGTGAPPEITAIADATP